MPERHSLREIWEDLALPELAMAIRLALGPAKLAFAFCGVLFACSLGLLMDRCARTVVVITPEISASTVSQTELNVYISGTVKQTRQFINDFHETGKRQGVFSTLFSFFALRFHEATTQLLDLGNATFFANVKYGLFNTWLCLKAIGWAFRFHPIYSVLFFSAVFLSGVFVGGGICRCTALEFAHDEKPGLFEAFNYTRQHFRSFLSAPLLPLGLIIVLGALLMLSGLMASIPGIGEIVFGITFAVALVFGFLITLMVLGSLAGGLLLLPAIAYEKSSGMDSIGRAFHYVLARPVWMSFYVLTETVLGTFFYLIIRFIFFLSLKMSYGLVYTGMKICGREDKLARIWPEPELMNFLKSVNDTSIWSESVAGFMISFVMLIIIAILLSCVISYFFCSGTIIYALMRKKVDLVEPGQVYKHLEQVKRD